MVTLAAVEAITAAPVIAFPVNREGAASRALETIRRHLAPAARLLPLTMPMVRDRGELEEAHAEAAKAIAAAAAGGEDVVYLSLGDPLFYSTFGYLAERFPGEVEVVSGVPAMSAMAAALGLPIADGGTPTMVVTGGDRRGIEAALEIGASLVIIKPRSLPDDTLSLLESAGAFSRARAAIELGGERQEVLTSVDRDAASRLPYFSILWIRPEAGGR